MTIAAYNNTAHYNGVVTLWQAVFGYPDKRNNPDLVIQKKLSVDDMLYVALEDDTVIGTVMVGYDGHRGWIYSLAVAPAFRKRGVATELLRHAEQALAAKGCMKINLQILESNEQVKEFYLKNGYSIEARISMGKQIPENIPE
ncbi:MAG TPA: GNAT family acetyltransferase [Treponemataceae bacterium]|nr:GNAT family acetyltransferase [Treponemataceae bacterium]